MGPIIIYQHNKDGLKSQVDELTHHGASLFNVIDLKPGKTDGDKYFHFNYWHLNNEVRPKTGKIVDVCGVAYWKNEANFRAEQRADGVFKLLAGQHRTIEIGEGGNKQRFTFEHQRLNVEKR